MSLRSRTFLTIVITFLVLFALLYFASETILMRSFSALEAQQVLRNVERARRTLRDDLQNLDALAYDWAAWDDTYAYVENGSPAYVESNLVDEAFEGLGVNLIVIFSEDGEVVFEKLYDFETGETVPLPDALSQRLVPGGKLVDHGQIDSSVTGLLLLPDGPMLLASRPIVTSHNEGPIRGAFIMGRSIDAGYLTERLRLPVAFYRLDEPLPSSLPDASSVSLTSAPAFVTPLDGQTMAGYLRLQDLDDEPILLMRVELPRLIHQQGQDTIAYVVSAILLTGVIFAVVIMLLVERQVLSRLSHLSQQVSAVAAGGDAQTRVTVSGDDELAHLAAEINDLLMSMEESSRALRESESRSRILLRAVPDSMLVVTDKGEVVELRPTAGPLLPVLVRMNAGDHLWDLDLPQEIVDSLHTHVTYTLAEGGVQDFECVCPINGAKFYGEVRVVALDGEEALVIIRDITERKRLEVQTRHQDRLAAVGQLAGGIAHDFNNILTTIILFSQIATSRTDLPNSAREAIVNVLSEARRAARLVRQMLDFSRRTELEMQPLELGPFVDEVVDVLRRTLPRDVAVLVDVNSGEHWVCADHISLRQVLTNLALNARDAMPSGGTLSVELAHLDLGVGEAPPAPEMEPGAWVRLTVADTGSGIAPEDRAHLFEPFFTTKGPEGHGLGLAQVHGIIRQHGGQVGVETEVGAGTAFHVYLPRIEAQQAQTVEVGEEEVPRGAGETVLLVDDEEHVRESARRILSDLGYEVLVASRGGEALKILREVAEVDLVVAELTTPLGEGGTLVGELRKHKGVPPLLVLAGHNVSDVERQVLGYDVAVLSKPFKVAEFARALRRTLGRGA